MIKCLCTNQLTSHLDNDEIPEEKYLLKKKL